MCPCAPDRQAASVRGLASMALPGRGALTVRLRYLRGAALPCAACLLALMTMLAQGNILPLPFFPVCVTAFYSFCCLGCLTCLLDLALTVHTLDPPPSFLSGSWWRGRAGSSSSELLDWSTARLFAGERADCIVERSAVFPLTEEGRRYSLLRDLRYQHDSDGNAQRRGCNWLMRDGRVLFFVELAHDGTGRQPRPASYGARHCDQ